MARSALQSCVVQGLVRLADYKYSEQASVAERLSHMLFHNILPYACQVRFINNPEVDHP